MVVYIFLFSFLIIGSGIVGSNKSSGFFFVSILFMGIIIGLRDLSVGADTLSYISDFYKYSEMSFIQMWNTAFKYKEPLYVIITWLFSLVSHKYTFFLLGWAMIPTIILYYSLKDELQSGFDYIFAFLVIFILGFFAFFVAGIRQTAALSIVLLSYKYLRNNKLVSFLICIGFAYLLHKSSLIFIIAYLIRFFSAKRQYFVIVCFAILSFIIIRSGTMNSFSNLYFNDTYDRYFNTSYESSQNLSAFYIQTILLLFCFLKRKALSTKDDQFSLLFTLASVGLIFQAMAGQLAEMSRMSFYFCIFQIILFPKVMREYNNWIKIVFIVACIIYLFFLTSANLPTYRFATI